MEPFAVAFDAQGNLYICEHTGQRLIRVDPAGQATSVAGTGELGLSGDRGPAAQAQFDHPHGVVFHRPSNALFVADTRNHRIRRVDLTRHTIDSFAGTEQGFGGDGGLATVARFDGTFAIDLRGNFLYVADLGNRRVRRIHVDSQVVETVAGNGEKGVPADGALAKDSPLVDPRAVAADSQGSVYVLERGGNALRRVDRAGRIKTLIGASDLDPPLKGPKHLCIDRRDRVIIADAENHLIRMYDPAGGRTVVLAGTGEPGTFIDENDPRKTQLTRPHGVYVDENDVLWVSDSYNGRVLKLTGWEP
jgi:sugar lactone lactonase YvrE